MPLLRARSHRRGSIVRKGENFNHPSRGAAIRVFPIKRREDVGAIRSLLAHHPRNLALFTLGTNTSLRPGELLDVRVGQVLGLKPMDTIEIKGARTGRTRRVPLNHACQESLQAFLGSLREKEQGEPQPAEFLFRGRRKRLSISTLNNLVKTWCREIGLAGNFGGHSLRKTYGYAQLFHLGLPVGELMRQLHHSNKQQTFAYLCLDPGERRALRRETVTGLTGFIPRGGPDVSADSGGTGEGLHGREELYRVLFENANDGIVLTDTEARVVEVNEANGRIFGWKREEVIGKNVFGLGLLSPAEAETYFKQLQLSFEQGRNVGMWEGEAIRKDGTRVFIEVNVNVVKRDGTPTGLLCVIRNVTDRKRMEKALQESEEMKRALLNATTDAVMLLDREGIVLDLNTAYADTFGRQARELIGSQLWDLLPDDHQGWKARIERVIRQAKHLRFETEYRGKWADNIIYPVSDGQGQVCRVAIFSHDITASKQTEESLRRHRDHLDEMVKERTARLEQTNTALKVLLRRREEDKIELEDRMVLNVKELVLPFLEDLKKSRLNDEQAALGEVIEDNLRDILSPFVRTLSSRFYHLTPTEIRIANMIKQGRSSKAIARQLNLSPRTVDIHRYHIRRKLGIGTKKTNLRTHLLSLQ